MAALRPIGGTAEVIVGRLAEETRCELDGYEEEQVQTMYEEFEMRAALGDQLNAQSEHQLRLTACPRSLHVYLAICHACHTSTFAGTPQSPR